MQLVMVHDLSAPAFGAPQAEVYAAALDMCPWADDVGFGCICASPSTESPSSGGGVLPHVRRVAEVYGGWQSEAPGQKPGPFAGKPSEEALRASPAYPVLSPEGVLGLVDDLGSDVTLYATPLLCGLDPAIAWESLRLFESDALPHLPKLSPIP